MASPLSAGLLDDIETWAYDYVLKIAQGVTEMMQADGGVVYGDQKLGRAERILAFQHAVQSGEMNSLIVVNPRLAKEMTDTYFRDVAASPVYAGGR